LKKKTALIYNVSYFNLVGGASVRGQSPRSDGTGDNFCEFWSVVKLLLLLSRGQATVKQGFVMNKNMFDVNSCNSHLIARRLVKDYCTLLIWEGWKMSWLGRNFC